jgi:type I restriction enzyme, S subunit
MSERKSKKGIQRTERQPISTNLGMTSEWNSTELQYLIQPGRGISYGIVQPGAEVTDGIPIVRVSDIRNGRINTASPLKVSPAIEANYARSRLQGGELLLTLVGTVGETAIASKKMQGWNTARAVGVIPVNDEVGAYWAQLVLNMPEVRERIRGRLNTTVQATLNLRDVAELPIILPPRAERKRIEHILGTLQDKIELNRKMNETLEAMARALFKSWFVDFDPVRAKAEGRSTGLPTRIAALFPDSFEDSELGEIPAGWSVLGLDQTARFLNGLALQKFPPQDGRFLPVIKIAQLRTENTAESDKASADLAPEYVVEDGDVLFSWSGSLECVLWAGGKGALNQHLFKVTSDKFPKWFYFLGIHQHLDEFRQIAADKATTMGHIQRHHLTAAKVIVPPAPLLREMNCHFAPLIDQIIQLKRESKAIAAVRDLLLPRIISGELRINVAESFVGEGV